MSFDVRYAREALAWEYDQRNSTIAPGELEWYLKYASQAGGPILELACGSGRLLVPIAAAGYEIDGIDISPAMLARCQGKLAGLDAATRERVRLICSDMATFSADRPYGLIFVAYNSLRYLRTTDRYAAVFDRVHRFLAPTGSFLFMVAQVDLGQFADGREVVVDWLEQPITNETTGLAVGSKFVSRLNPSGNRIVTERTYQIERRGIDTDVVHEVTESPLVSLAEYGSMLTRSRFVSHIHGGYDEQPLTETGRIFCFVGQKEEACPARL